MVSLFSPETQKDVAATAIIAASGDAETCPQHACLRLNSSSVITITAKIARAF
jgi:hypothetical protein